MRYFHFIRMSLSRILVTLTGALLWACTDPDTHAGGFMDETETTEISGILRNPSGTPCAKVTVTLQRDFRDLPTVQGLDSIPVLTVMTDSGGSFRVSRITIGTWHLLASQDSLGILRTIVVNKDTLRMDADTLQPMQTVIFSSESFHTLVYIPQLNQVFDLTQGAISLPLPIGNYEVFPATGSAQLPAVDAQADTLFNAVLSDSNFSTVGLWAFTTGDEWTDASGSHQTLTNVNAPPTSNSAGYISFNGTACFQINYASSLSAIGFKIQTTVRLTTGATGTQTILCANDLLTGADSWCLRVHSPDTLVFWYHDGLLVQDSLMIPSGLPTGSWTDITAMASNSQIVLQTGLTPYVKTVTTDFSAVTVPISVGCREASSPEQFFFGDIDQLQFSVYKP